MRRLVYALLLLLHAGHERAVACGRFLLHSNRYKTAVSPAAVAFSVPPIEHDNSHKRRRSEIVDRDMSIGSSIGVRLHKFLWSTITRIGTRRVIGLIRGIFPSYRETIFYFEPPPPKAAGDAKLVALTIDDGLSRSGSGTAMVSDVMSLLSRHKAGATFFVCSDYCTVDDDMRAATRDLVWVHNHELGNHMSMDKAGYFKMNEEAFRSEFEAANEVLEELVNDDSCDGTVGRAVTAKDGTMRPYAMRWFRAPQALFTPTMRRVLAEQSCSESRDILHVLGDCYCDDWALASKDPNFVCRTMLQQIQEGSVIVMHMPERETDREATLDVLKVFLQNLCEKGYRCVSLSDMWDACDGRHAHSRT